MAMQHIYVTAAIADVTGIRVTLLPTKKLCHSLQIFAAWKSSDNDGVVKGRGRKYVSRIPHGDRIDETDCELKGING